MPHSEDFITIEEALEGVKAGRIIVLVDDEQRENEGGNRKGCPQWQKRLIRQNDDLFGAACRHVDAQRLHPAIAREAKIAPASRELGANHFGLQHV